MPRPLAVFGFSYYLAAVILFMLPSVALIYAAPMLILLAILSFVFKKLRAQGVLPTAFIAALLAAISIISANEYTLKPALSCAGENKKVSAAVKDTPVLKNGRYYINAETVEVDCRKIHANIRVVSLTPIDCEAGDIISYTGDILSNTENSNKFGEYYKSQELFLASYVYNGIEVTESSNKQPMDYVLKVKNAISESFRELLPGENGDLIRAALLGDTSDILTENMRSFNNIGLIHFFSVSGLHLTIWVMSLYKLLIALKLSRRKTSVITLLFLLFFVALTGFSSPCLRAGLMLSVMLVGNLFKARSDSINSLGLAIFILIAINPYSALSLGLQYSFFSTLGILIFDEKLKNMLNRMFIYVDNKPLKRLSRYVCGEVSVCLSALAATMPITIINFRLIQSIAPVSNLFVLPFMSLSMLIGGIASLINLVPYLYFIAKPLMFPAGLMMKMSLHMAKSLESLSFSEFAVYDEYAVLWLAVTMIIIAAILVSVKNKKTVFKRYLSIALAAWFLTLMPLNAFVYNKTHISVIDAGDGLAVSVKHKNKTVLLFSGITKSSFNNIVYFLDTQIIRQTALIVFPEPETETRSVIANIINYYKPSNIVASTNNDVLDYYKNYNNINIGGSFKIEVDDLLTVEYKNGGDGNFAYISTGNKNILICFKPDSQCQNLDEKYKNADLLICKTALPYGLPAENFDECIVSVDADRLPVLYEYGDVKKSAVTTADKGIISRLF